MPTDKDVIITSTVYIGQPLTLIQCNNFVSITGQLLALLDKRSLVCLTFTIHTLGLQITVFCYINGSDKLEYCIHSL